MVGLPENIGMIQTRFGRFNGFGGKVDVGETSAQAAARELKVCAATLSLKLLRYMVRNTLLGRSWYRGPLGACRDVPVYHRQCCVGISD